MSRSIMVRISVCAAASCARWHSAPVDHRSASKTFDGMSLWFTSATCRRLWPPLVRCIAASAASDLSLSQKKHKRKKLLTKDAFRKSQCCRYVYLIDGESIDCIVKHLCPKADQETACVIECSAGPGFLTKKLLESGIKHVHLFDYEDMDYLSMLEKISKQHEGRISLHLASNQVVDYIRDLRIGITNIVTENTDITAYKQNWMHDPPIKTFVPLPPFTDREFVSGLINDLCRRDGLFGPGRMQLILLTTFFPFCEMRANPLTDPPYYGYFSVMAQSMLDVELIHRVPLAGLIPQIHRTRINNPDDPRLDTKSLFMVKVTPKASLTTDIPPELWSDYRFFVKQAMFRKTGHVIPFFEKYFPHCGTRLIRIGVPLYSRFMELNPSDFLRIFNEFSNWPEYSSSTFKMASASFSEEFDADNEEEEEDEDDADKVIEGSEVSGSEKLVSEVVFA